MELKRFVKVELKRFVKAAGFFLLLFIETAIFFLMLAALTIIISGCSGQANNDTIEGQIVNKTKCNIQYRNFGTISTLKLAIMTRDGVLISEEYCEHIPPVRLDVLYKNLSIGSKVRIEKYPRLTNICRGFGYTHLKLNFYQGVYPIKIEEYSTEDGETTNES